MKKIILLVSGIGCGILLTFLFFVLNDTCGLNKILCKDIYTILVSFLFMFPVVFIFSLITYFLKDEVFKTWSKFTYIWIPISIILTLITPGGSGSFFVSLWDPQMTAIVMSGLYFIISLIIVIFKVATIHKK